MARIMGTLADAFTRAPAAASLLRNETVSRLSADHPRILSPRPSRKGPDRKSHLPFLGFEDEIFFEQRDSFHTGLIRRRILINSNIDGFPFGFVRPWRYVRRNQNQAPQRPSGSRIHFPPSTHRKIVRWSRGHPTDSSHHLRLGEI